MSKMKQDYKLHGELWPIKGTYNEYMSKINSSKFTHKGIVRFLIKIFAALRDDRNDSPPVTDFLSQT